MAGKQISDMPAAENRVSASTEHDPRRRFGTQKTPPEAPIVAPPEVAMPQESTLTTPRAEG